MILGIRFGRLGSSMHGQRLDPRTIARSQLRAQGVCSRSLWRGSNLRGNASVHTRVGCLEGLPRDRGAVVHHPRKHGVSKYGFTRFFKGFLDLLTVYFLTGFRQRPQHLLGFVGLLSFFTGLLGLLGLTGAWVLTRVVPGWTPIHLHERALFYYAIVGCCWACNSCRWDFWPS